MSFCAEESSFETELDRLGPVFGVLGLRNLAASLIDDRERGIAERIFRLQFDHLQGVRDRQVRFGEIDVEFGEQAVSERESGIKRDRFLQLFDRGGFVAAIAESMA